MSAKASAKSISMGPVVWALIAGLVLAGVAGWWTYRSCAKAQQAFTRAEFRLNRIRSLPYAPVDGGAEKLAKRNEQLQQLLDGKERVLSDVWGKMVSDPPKDATAVYFYLAAMVDRQRKAAAAAGVAVKTDERFGFSEFARQGPDQSLLKTVHAQAVVQERVLNLLWAARPASLKEAKRAWVYSKVEDSTADPWSTPTEEVVMPKLDDLFKAKVVDGDIPSGTQALDFLYVFEGYTDSLRDWLSALQKERLPFRVVSLAVEPLMGDEVSRKSKVRSSEPSSESLKENPFLAFQQDEEDAASSDEGGVPIIDENLSRFTVRLECVIPELKEGGAL